MIQKQAQDKKAYRRDWQYTDSARIAWSKIIEEYKKKYPKGKVLLPGYIGWSANEGSGIFDSVEASGLDFDFYSLDARLEIDVESLKQKVSEDKTQLVLLVHYFGFTDKKYNEICDWLIANKVYFVEDCAHAWLSDLIGGTCGRKGDYAFYSLHKLLPIDTGGVMVYNNSSSSEQVNNTIYLDLHFDLFSIYEARISNYKYLVQLLKDVEGVDVLYSTLEPGICPQTLPAIVKNYDRSQLYHEMNNEDFGLVSLYHTMIKQLSDSPSEAASQLSKNIINFPIHQDVTHDQLASMVEKLKEILNA